MNTALYFSRGSYYLILTLSGFWVLGLLRALKEKTGDSPPSRMGTVPSFFWKPLLLCAALTTFIFVSSPPYFRVLSDETNLAAVSKSMTYEKTVDNVTMGKWYYENFYPLNREIPKRPLLFPFLVHLIHTLTGYRAENVFVLNFLLLFFLFWILWNTFSKISPLAGALAVIFTAAQPVIVQTATSGAFDLLFVLLAFLSLLSLYEYLERPSAAGLQWLVLNLLTLSHTRYEALLFFVLIPLFLAGFRRLRKEDLKPVWFYLSIPLFLLPRLWQHLLVGPGKELFENDGGLAAFSVKNLLNHSVLFLNSLADFHFYFPYATLINLAGAASLLYLLQDYVYRRWPKEKTQKQFLQISAVCVVACWAVITSFHIGDPTHPATSRYFALFYLILSLSAAYLLGTWKGLNRAAPAAQKAGEPRHRRAVTVLALGLWLLYHPQNVENRFSNTMTLPREYRTEIGFFKGLGHRNILIVTERPGQWTVHNYGAVSFEHANENAGALLAELKRRLFRDIYVIQEIAYETGKPLEEHTLSAEYRLEPALEFQNKAEAFVRISKAAV